MSAIDIICIPEKTFLQYRNSVVPNEKTVKAYEDLIACHSCFSATQQPYEPQHPRQSNKHRTHRAHYHSNNHSFASSNTSSYGQHNAKKPKKPNDDPLAIFKGLLNVLNTSNFEKIQRKFKLAITDSNMTPVCHLVLETATQQAFFIDNYVRLLNGCRLSYPDINVVIANYVNDYIDKKEFLPMEAMPEDFVEQQKLKKLAIGKTILITELLKSKIPSVSITHQLFAYSIVNTMQQTVDLHATDLLLSSLQEVKKRCRVIVDQNILKQLMFNHTDTRILFMFEQLL